MWPRILGISIGVLISVAFSMLPAPLAAAAWLMVAGVGLLLLVSYARWWATRPFCEHCDASLPHGPWGTRLPCDRCGR